MYDISSISIARRVSAQQTTHCTTTLARLASSPVLSPIYVCKMTPRAVAGVRVKHARGASRSLAIAHNIINTQLHRTLHTRLRTSRACPDGRHAQLSSMHRRRQRRRNVHITEGVCVCMLFTCHLKTGCTRARIGNYAKVCGADTVTTAFNTLVNACFVWRAAQSANTDYLQLVRPPGADLNN